MSRKFFSGPPPSVGWWPTESRWYNFFNGRVWSWGVWPEASMLDVEMASREPHWDQPSVRWAHWHDDPNLHLADRAKLPEVVA